METTPVSTHVGRALVPLVERLEKALFCPICFQTYENPSTTRCMHSYCRACIQQALRYSNLCPLCKAKVTRRSLCANPLLERAVAAYQTIQSVLSTVVIEDSPEDAVQYRGSPELDLSQLYPYPVKPTAGGGEEEDDDDDDDDDVVDLVAAPAVGAVAMDIDVEEIPSSPSSSTDEVIILEELSRVNEEMQRVVRLLDSCTPPCAGSPSIAAALAAQVTALRRTVSRGASSTPNVSVTATPTPTSFAALATCACDALAEVRRATGCSQIPPLSPDATPGTPGSYAARASQACDAIAGIRRSLTAPATSTACATPATPSPPATPATFDAIASALTQELTAIQQHLASAAAPALATPTTPLTPTTPGTPSGTPSGTQSGTRRSQRRRRVRRRVIALAADVDAGMREILKSVVASLGQDGGVETTVNMRCESATTHVVCPAVEGIVEHVTHAYLAGIARGVWVVTMEWVFESAAQQKWLPEDSFEVRGDTLHPHGGGARAARADPGGVFGGLAVCVLGRLKVMGMRPKDVADVCTAAGARVVADVAEADVAVICGGGVALPRLPPTCGVTDVAWVAQCIACWERVPFD